MKRNRHGVNFDLGMPLDSAEEFEILYVEANTRQKERLGRWLDDANEGPLVVAGQIGSGKTTLIKKALQEAKRYPDIGISLDTDAVTVERGAFWGLFLGKALAYAHKIGLDLSSFTFIHDLIGKSPSPKGRGKIKDNDAVVRLAGRLAGPVRSFADFKRSKRLFALIDENIELLRRQSGELIDGIEKKLGRRVLIFAEGIDKFSPHTGEFLSLLDLLVFLNRYKTLYEANFIHLMNGDPWHLKVAKVFLPAAGREQVGAILEKRLGIYNRPRLAILPLLAELSGGNLRQGLRLLLEYNYAVDEAKREPKAALDDACLRVRDDLLGIASHDLEPALLKVIDRDGFLYSGTMNDLATREPSQNAIYLNWILICGEADEALKWPAIVNPLLLPAVRAFKDLPESPEIRMLKEWAAAHEMSPFGLDIDTREVTKEKFFDIMAGSGLLGASLNIVDIFSSMASYFLNPERKDKFIIAYQDKEIARLTNDFILGKAGTYQPGHFIDIHFAAIPDHRLDIFIGGKGDESIDGYSIFFDQRLSPTELISLDQRRDIFIGVKMIWWIPYPDLLDYLKYWQQLRQFFKIYRLEEDVFATISKKEIKEDIGNIAAAGFPGPGSRDLKKRLRRVLAYLEKRKDG